MIRKIRSTDKPGFWGAGQIGTGEKCSHYNQLETFSKSEPLHRNCQGNPPKTRRFLPAIPILEHSQLDIPLIKTKLSVPATRPEPSSGLKTRLIARPRLFERLDRGVNGKLTLVSAPAGYGKTTLIATWVRNLERPFSWLSLDASDNDPVRFITYLIATLQKTEPSLGKELIQLLQSPKPPPLESVLTSLINEIAEVSVSFSIVLDDYHSITAEAIHALLRFLIDHQPRQMHLVLISRADPPLSLARMRAWGQLTELRSDDLRFTMDETRELFNQVIGLELPGEALTSLAERTEGWITGLQLAGLSLMKHPEHETIIKLINGDHRYIMDYLMEEVLQQQPAEVQKFLLKTGILDRMCESLCTAVTGREDSKALLERLEAANLFLVPLDDQRDWYRYHHLFAAFLQARLRKTDPVCLEQTHQRASDWFRDQGLMHEAIDHALSAEDFPHALDLIAAYTIQLFQRGAFATLVQWLEKVPESLLIERVDLSVRYAWATLMNGRIDLAKLTLARVNDPSSKADRWMFLVVQTEIARHQGDLPQMKKLAQKALTDLPKTEEVLRGIVTADLAETYAFRTGQTRQALAMVADTIHNLQHTNHDYFLIHLTDLRMAILALQGRLREANNICQQTIITATERNLTSMLGAIYARAGKILREWNDLGAAEDHLHKGLDVSEGRETISSFVSCSITLARIRKTLGDHKAVKQILQRAKTTAKGNTIQLARLEAWESWSWADQGWVAITVGKSADDMSLHEKPRFETLFGQLKLVQILLNDLFEEKNHPQQVPHEKLIAVLENLLTLTEGAKQDGTAVEILVALTKAHAMNGDKRAAAAALRRALSMAEPNGYIRTFVDAGDPIPELLVLVRNQGYPRSPQPPRSSFSRLYLDKLVTTCVSIPLGTPGDSQLIEPLSQRETEVLSLLASTGASNTKMAEQLSISEGTIRWHLKNIYRKLGVKNRTQAVTKARELGLTS